MVYFTKSSNIGANGLMGDIKLKHTGIYFSGNVWHYGNTGDQVKKQLLADFNRDMGTAYGSGTVTRFTAIPLGAELLTTAEIKALVP